jgi:hypothetical protein
VNTLNLHDLPYLAASVGGVPPPIDPSDANTQAWWSADYYIGLDKIGDRMDTTIDKTSTVAPNFNLSQYPAPSAAPAALPSGDTRGNYVRFSEDIFVTTAWAVSNCTKNDATHATFTAQNGYVRQTNHYTAAGETWKLAITCRAVSGNTNLHFMHTNSPTGDTTAVAVTNVLATYTVTFLGRNTYGVIYVGIQDRNGAGWGQIEVTKWHLYRDDQSSTYIQIVDTRALAGPRNGTNVFTVGGSYSWDAFMHCTASRASAGPQTLYASAWVTFVRSRWMMLANNPAAWDHICGCDVGPPAERLGEYHGAWFYGAGANKITLGGWGIYTFVFNGASSEVRLNLNAANVGNPGANSAANRWEIGGDATVGFGFSADFHEVITRYTADNTATQDSFIEYMADQVGLTV